MWTALGVLLLTLSWVSQSAAAPPEFLTRISAGEGSPGAAAGEVDNPRGVTASSGSGHVYVTDLNNARVDEYTAWGLFVKSWGWDVAPDGAPGDTISDQLETCGPPEPEEVPAAGLCQKGSQGDRRGEFGVPFGIALDSFGNIYVSERANFRVQKFTPQGEFVLMFGGEVNRTKVEDGAPAAEQNVCPVDPADVCQAGQPGDAPSHFSDVRGDQVAHSPTTDAIMVGDVDRIQIFNLDGSYREEIGFKGSLAPLAGGTVNAIDVDASGNIYFSLEDEEDVFKVSAAGEPLSPGEPEGSEYHVERPAGIAVDVDGNIYAIEDPVDGAVEMRVIKFDPVGNKLLPTEGEEEVNKFFPYISFQGPSLTGITTNLCAGSEKPGNLYISAFRFGSVAYVDAYGSPPLGCEPPPAVPPVIVAQYASAVGRDSATVQAEINPKFWDDTTYFVEYGLGKCSEGGCGAKAPIPTAVLTDIEVNKALRTAGVVLEGLEPGASYHYRFVAQSGGGGPVAGQEASFTAFASPPAASSCPNDAVRGGLGARLPDCRAYEMVSPLDKEGGDVALWIARNALFPYFFEVHRSSHSGDRLTYTAWTGFGAPGSAPFASQYLAERNAAGWASTAISPARTEPPVEATVAFDNEFHLFSTDLCTAWVRHYSVSTLAPKAIEGYPNLYRRANCAEPPFYEALTTFKPAALSAADYSKVRARGTSEDGAHAIFTANGRLLPSAPLLEKFDPLLYEHTPEGLRFVCFLPNGKASPRACSAGMGATGSSSSVRNAISADGARIFWTAHDGPAASSGTPGPIYVRIGGEDTLAVSGAVAPDLASYWTAADDGSKAIFEFASGPLQDQLYEFDVETETASLIAKGVEGPLGASEDASRIYFASAEDLDGGGPGTVGAHNLYFYEAGEGGGAFTFVMALASADIGGSDAAPAPIERVPTMRSAAVSPDGLHATFTSVASPTPSGYDNLDAASGQPDQEVYRYDAVAGELTCVSCNPSGARPTGALTDTSFWAAARIQGWEIAGRGPRVISDNGSRIFFESHEALEPADTNSTWDVYQWEEEGKGTCTDAAETFSPASGGCVELLSSGQSPAKSTFLDADPSGDNVFIGTLGSLVGVDYGLNDVYVARVGGGFSSPRQPSPCAGEACQSPPVPPPVVTPSSEAFEGEGNVPRSKPRRKRCPKGKRRVVRKGKVRCVRKVRQGSTKRRASR
jgi:hypothetical protein